MKLRKSLLALWASVISPCLGITLSPPTGGLAMARVLFGGSTDVFSSSSGFSGDSSAIRSFTNGPFGMSQGIILSTGSLDSPLAPGNSCPSSYTTDQYDAWTQNWCGPDSYNGASYLLNVLPTKATTLLIDMVIASCDPDAGDRVMVLVNGVNYAKDENGTPLDSSSKYLSKPWGIPAPNGDTAFAMSSPPLRFSIPVPKSYVELKIAVCDRLDGYGDTAVMIKIRPCVDCDQSFKVNYDTTSIVSTTTYEATSVITQPASGTALGTISYVTYVTASATSTASWSFPGSTSADLPTTSLSPTLSSSSDVAFLTLSTTVTSSIPSTLSTTTSASTSEDSAMTSSRPTSSYMSESIWLSSSSGLESENSLYSSLESTSTAVPSASIAISTTLSLDTRLPSDSLSSTSQSVTSSEYVSTFTSKPSYESASTETLASSSTLPPSPRCRPRRSR